MSNKVDGTDCYEVFPPWGRILDGIAGRRGVREHDGGPRFRVGGVAVSDANDTVADVVSRQTYRCVGQRSSPSETNSRWKDVDYE